MNSKFFKFKIIFSTILLLISFFNYYYTNNSSASMISFNKCYKDSNVFGSIISLTKLKTNNKNIKDDHIKVIPIYIDKHKINQMQYTQNISILFPINKETGHIIYNRQYDNIPRGSYNGKSTYIVMHGDTIFYIAWITGNKIESLAKINNIKAPYNLYVGQILKIDNYDSLNLKTKDTISSSANKKTINNYIKSTQIKNKYTINHPVVFNTEYTNKRNYIKLKKNNKESNSIIKELMSTPLSNANQLIINDSLSKSSKLLWYWPTKGRIIKSFFSSEIENRGIDIAGSKGQPIKASASGRVVYVGNALRGYGNLIIIKHNNEYLSAYAHNDTILVHEQQEVKAKQKIATMGNTGTISNRLHFEIRYKGKSVNPLQYLSQN